MTKKEYNTLLRIICFAIGILVAYIGHHCLNDCPKYHSHEVKPSIVHLKHPTAFANYSVVTTKDDYDRVLNLKNISSVRKIEDRRLEVDGKMVILFKDSAEREIFIGKMKGEIKNGQGTVEKDCR